MAIQFIIDSASDVLPSEAAELGVIHLPQKIRFGDQEYNDAVDLTHHEFYEKLIESEEMPSTSQIPPVEFEEAFSRVVAAGDTAILITLSSDLSGTYQSAMLAASEFPGKAFVVDSRNVCIGERLLLLRGLALRDQGLSAEEIIARLDEEKHAIRVMALLDTLEYLKRGGRISAAAAIAGSLLSIKPVISIESGKVAVIGKARGSKHGNNLLRELVKKGGGINFEKPFCLAYSGLSDALLRKYIADSAELWQGRADELPISTVGCAIGSHAGPGAIAVAYFENP